MFYLALVTFFVIMMTIRAFLIVLGTYKDPLLASFETYGEEYTVKPIIMFAVWIAVLLYVSLFWYLHSELVFAVGFMVVILLGAFHNSLSNLVDKYKDFFCRFPKWYYELIEMTDREERRRIAYMWLHLPPPTRMIYNVNHASFIQWVEQVLLTVAQ